MPRTCGFEHGKIFLRKKRALADPSVIRRWLKTHVTGSPPSSLFASLIPHGVTSMRHHSLAVDRLRINSVYTRMIDSSASFRVCRTCACSALRHASRAVTQHYEKHFRGTGLRATQFTVLATLVQTGPLSISELSKTLGLERTTLSRNMRLLEKNGWVSAITHDDQRIRRMQLTRKGRAKAAAALPIWRRADVSAEKVLRRFGLQSRPSRPSLGTK